MSRMKWNLDLLEEVKKQHDEALISTEHVVNKVRSDLYSMTEEVWEGEDADIARDQLHELSFKEMPDTYDQIDTCNNVIKKAQKEAYESKNFCNDFPQIFSSGSMPSDGNQSRCTGDLMCDEDSCEGLKSSMKAAGENARNVRSAISSVESILASLETDFAKFDYSSYTQPIKEQTQKVAERTEMYNTAVTRYEHKTKELDHTVSNALKLATPDFVPAPLDPSCLGIGEELHFGDSKITGSLEEYITAKIDGELDEAQIKDILSMLFDKENVDISEYSEEDFGMAFIKLSEEKKRAMLMEMGYSKEQIDSILDSCKGNKAVTVGNSIGRTLIEKIADKDGNKHGRLGKTGKASTLGLAGIKGPRQFNTDFAKTNAVATDATTAGSGSSSKDKQKPKQKPKNNANNTTSNSGSNGNNTATASADPHAEYKENVDDDVAEKIDDLFNTYGEDLNGLTEEAVVWEDCDEITKEALAAIYEKSIEKVDNSFNDAECEQDCTRAGNILHTIADFSAAEVPTVFNPERINSFESYLDQNSVGYDIVQQLKTAQKGEGDNWAAFSYLDISLCDAGISFGFRNPDDPKDIEEYAFYTSDDRSLRYIKWCEENDPNTFNHLKNDIGFDNNYIVSMYTDCNNSYDMTLIDKLAKTDENYSDVFVVDPDKISTECSYRLADYSYQLLSKEEYNEYLNYANGILVPGVKYPESDEYAKGYLEIMTFYSGEIAGKLKKGAWIEVNNNISYYDEKLDHQMFLANSNEAFWTKVYYEYDEGGLGQRSTVCYDASERQPGDDFNTYMPYLTMIPSSYGGNLPFFDEQGQMQFHYNVKGTHYYGYDSVEDITTSKDTHLINAGSLDFINGLKDYDDNWLEELERKRREKMTSQSEDTAIAIVKTINPQVGTLLAISKEIYESDMLGTGKTAAEAIKTYYDGAPDGAVTGGKLTAAGLDAYVKFSKIQKEYEETKKRIDATTKLMLGYSAVSGSPEVSISEYSNIREYVRWSGLGINALYKDADITGDFEYDGQPYNTVRSLLDAHREDIINVAYEILENKTVSYTQEQVTQAYNSLIRSNAGDNDSDYPVGDYKKIQDIPYDLFMALVKTCDKFLPPDKSIESVYNKAVGNI